MKYTARQIPGQPEVTRELQRIAEALSLTGDYDVLQATPDKPREGMVRFFASGVLASAGLHEYVGGSWTKL